MKRRPLYGFLTAEAVSITGTRISMIAIPWLVLTTTGSATRTGVVAMAELLPLVLLKLLGGPLIDRVGPRRISISCDAASVLSVGLVPLAYDAGHLSFPLLVALVAVSGALRGPGDAAKTAYLPTLVQNAQVPMERATGLSAGVERTASTLGAAFAGGLVAAIGPAHALYLDAVSFGLALLVFAWATTSVVSTRATQDARAGAGVEAAESAYFAELAGGWRFLRGDRVLLSLALMVALTNLIDAAYTSVLVPVWGHDYGRGAGGIGLVFAVFSGASILGALAAAAWGDRLPRYLTYLVAFLIAGAPRFAVMAFDIPIVAVLVVCVVGGLASGFINPVIGALMFERIPEAMMGRVSSLISALCWALMPFGGLLGGLLIGGSGLTAAMLICGAAYFVVTMLPAADRRWREMDRPTPTPAADAELVAQ